MKPSIRLLWRPVRAIALLIYILVFGEVFMRVMNPQALVPRFVTGAPDGIRANLPSTSFRQVTPEVDATITYNSKGMRATREYALARTPGQCRIALLGDSFFVGFESTYEDSFAAQLERVLRERGHDCEILNFAVSGFGTAEDLRVFASRVEPYKPDVLLVSWHRTDPADNRRSKLYSWDGTTLKPSARTYLPGVKISDTLMAFAPYRWAVEHSHFYNAAREWIGRTGKDLLLVLASPASAFTPAKKTPRDDDDAVPEPTANDIARVDSRQSLDIALLEALDAQTRQAGGHMLLFEIPDFRTRTDIVSSLRVLHPSVYERIAVASPLASMKAQAGPDAKFYQEQGQSHWTPRGNRLAAETAANALLARDWLPAAPSAGLSEARR